MNYIKNFHQSRQHKIGASEIGACIPHPEKSGSVAGYEQTAMTIWELKTGRREPDEMGIAADIGHHLEPMALKIWLQNNFDESAKLEGATIPYSDIFYRGHILCELDKNKDGYPNAVGYQANPFLHHTVAENDFCIAHTDMIDPGEHRKGEGIIVEGKSSGYWPSRRGDDPYTGYDMKIKGNQGIPLKTYFQVNFQAAVYNDVYGINFNRLYVALLFDTNSYHSWEIKPDLKVQERLLEICHHMKKCIDKDIPPKEYAMNQHDIKLMYPKIEEDYRILSGDEMQTAIDISKEERHAKKQEKLWKEKKKTAQDAMSIILKDTKTVKGIVDGEIVDIAGWQERAGSEKIIPLSEIDKDSKEYNYLVRNNMIKKSSGSRSVNIKFKGE